MSKVRSFDGIPCISVELIDNISSSIQAILVNLEGKEEVGYRTNFFVFGIRRQWYN